MSSPDTTESSAPLGSTQYIAHEYAALARRFYPGVGDVVGYLLHATYAAGTQDRAGYLRLARTHLDHEIRRVEQGQQSDASEVQVAVSRVARRAIELGLITGVPCPRCEVPAMVPCKVSKGSPVLSHRRRLLALDFARKEAGLPVTPRSNTMDELGIRDSDS